MNKSVLTMLILLVILSWAGVALAGGCGLVCSPFRDPCTFSNSDLCNGSPEASPSQNGFAFQDSCDSFQCAPTSSNGLMFPDFSAGFHSSSTSLGGPAFPNFCDGDQCPSNFPSASASARNRPSSRGSILSGFGVMYFHP